MFWDLLLLKEFHQRIVSLKFKRVRAGRDLRPHQPDSPYLELRNMGTREELYSTSPEVRGQCGVPGQITCTLDILLPPQDQSLCPGSSFDTVTQCFFSQLHISILYAPWLVEWWPASMTWFQGHWEISPSPNPCPSFPIPPVNSASNCTIRDKLLCVWT